MIEPLEIEILGQKYTVKGDADERHLATLVEFVNKRIDEVIASNPKSPPLKAAILAFLAVTEELFRLREELNSISLNTANINARAEELANLLDN